MQALLPSFSAAQRNLDSLRNAWHNSRLHDTLRLQALHDFAWEGYGYSQPDSAYYFAGVMYDYAKQKNLPSWMAKALNVQGNTLVVQSKYVEAYDRYRRSLEIAENTGDKNAIALALHRIGIIYFYQGDKPRAIDYYSRSLKLREEIGDKKGISASLNNLGIVYSQEELYDKALDFFTRSLALGRELGDKRGEASALNNLGLVYKAQGEAEKAFDYYTASMKISEELNDRRDVAAALNNIGHIHEIRGNLDEALKSFGESVEIKKTIGDKQGIATSLVNIGLIQLGRKEFSNAVENCEEAFNSAGEIGALQEQQKACECLYKSYKTMGKQEKALVYHEKLLDLNDSLQVQETTRILQHIEFAKQMLADSLARAGEKFKMQQAHRAELRRKNQIRNALILSSGLLLAGAGALYTRIRYIRRSRAAIAKEKELSDNLLLNILPEEIASELKQNGKAAPRKFENVSILFTDFQEFTRISSSLSPEKLVTELNECFRIFDQICGKYKIEKIKTIGDAYMAAGGLPVYTPDSVKNTVLAALEMAEFMRNRYAEKSAAGDTTFEMRAGVHTGPVVAGIVGVRKFQYDIWGDTVNTASRIEGSGEAGKVNISRQTYELIKDDRMFQFEHRGELMVKGKGCTEMYFVSVHQNLPVNTASSMSLSK